MNMQALMREAQKMQKELTKTQEELEKNTYYKDLLNEYEILEIQNKY